MERVAASARVVRLAALAFVRRNPRAFSGLTNLDVAPSRLYFLQAILRTATVDGEDYDMSAYVSDDLRDLVEHTRRAGIPRFEVEIGWPASAPAPFPPSAMSFVAEAQ